MTAARSLGLARVADLLEQAVRELRSLAGTCEGDLDPLRPGEAQCDAREPESAPSPMHPEKPMLMTAGQVASELQVHVRTLRRMNAAGEGPQPIKVRGATRWRRPAVERWVARKES